MADLQSDQKEELLNHLLRCDVARQLLQKMQDLEAKWVAAMIDGSVKVEDVAYYRGMIHGARHLYGVINDIYMNVGEKNG